MRSHLKITRKTLRSEDRWYSNPAIAADDEAGTR